MARWLARHRIAAERPRPPEPPGEAPAGTAPQGRITPASPLPGPVIEADRGPIRRPPTPPEERRREPGGGGGGAGGAAPPRFHKPVGPEDFGRALRLGVQAVRRNLGLVMVLTCATNLLILAIPIYLFQISDRVLTSRSVDTLVMLTIVIAAAVVLQAVFDAVRRFVLMRTAVEVAARLGAPILSAASAAALHGTGREYQTLGDLQQLRGFIVSGTLLSFLDVPFAPLFILAIYFVHPHLGTIVVGTSLALLVITLINQKLTARPFAEANAAQSRANLHLDSMSRNSQIINALAMIPEAVRIWGRDTATSLTAQVHAQDRNIAASAASRAVRLLTQVAMLGWGAYLAILGEITGGMVIAASIIAGRALAPIEGAIEGWSGYAQARAAYGRIAGLLTGSKLQFERLNLPNPEGRLDVERLLYVPGGTKQVVLNGVSFALTPGESLAIIGNSGAGKTTLGKMLVGSILPTSGNVRLDLMDLRNWDPRQLGENIGYLPQDVQLFPGSIKDNIGRMRLDATDAQIYAAARLADVHEMIANLPQGYETVVAADGAPLSGGQKQRIALARAFFGEPRFVVLDEPNSNLDSAGDKALAQALRHAKENRITVVVVTQKPTLLTVVDKIMLLADGSIQMFGERMQVLQRLAGDKAPRPAPRAPGPSQVPGQGPGQDPGKNPGQGGPKS
ncbi:type I secretion system permease/ATPase [Limimaricola pyoseonensis]|nr:type I secretion system permease/ATPase [Limimaricola pyoseonensis]